MTALAPVDRFGDTEATWGRFVRLEPGRDEGKAFDPSQPREPAGSSSGGQWTSGGGGIAVAEPPAAGPAASLAHGTTEDHLRSILTEGLRANMPVNYDFSRPGSVYASDNIEEAVYWAVNVLLQRGQEITPSAGAARPAIVEVKIPADDPRLIPDRNFSGPWVIGGPRSRPTPHYEYQGSIPPDWITRAWLAKPLPPEGSYRALRAPNLNPDQWERVKAFTKAPGRRFYVPVILEPKKETEHAHPQA